MRDLVNKKSFLVRKKLDNFLHWLFPNNWVPLYTSVTFTRMRYHEFYAVQRQLFSAKSLQVKIQHFKFKISWFQHRVHIIM